MSASLPQRALRDLFMRIEALFNRAFGDRLNPFYHLGQMTFYLFWLIAGTGLFLYIFFDTSVTGAYRSTSGLTHGQRYLGGIVRSVHRYASDAMVVGMLLHMARHWAFDRLRGFRWFSWITGIGLLWLVFIAGANGYMLPWDRLAQFVTQASFEWLDWIPLFGGTLIRNFIYDHNVSDRLFSLLVFVHIGVPLVTLLLLWVHVQRVPKATTMPPRATLVGVPLLLIAMALVVPVDSQGGPAQLGTAPEVLSLDWFLLGLYPLVYKWPLGYLWALVLGVTGLLVLAPWLPPRRYGRDEASRLTVHPGAVTLPVRRGETLLDAGLRAGLALPFDCRSGGCGVCVCTVLNGTVDYGAYQRAALTDAMRARGQALMCCATTTEDVEIEVEGLVPAEQAPRQYRAEIAALERLAPDVMRVVLTLTGGERMQFLAGQYINILVEDGVTRSYSFANPPGEDANIELHIRRAPGGLFSPRVFEQLAVGDVLDLTGPHGRFTLRDSDRPIIFIAGATGFAPIKSIIEDAFRRRLQRPMWLYWGVRHREDLYAAELAESWQAQHPNFHFIPVLSDIPDDDPWPGRRGLVHEAMLVDFPGLAGFELYACGSVAMVEAALPELLAHGLDENFCYSDAFVPAHLSRSPPAAK